MKTLVLVLSVLLLSSGYSFAQGVTGLEKGTRVVFSNINLSWMNDIATSGPVADFSQGRQINPNGYHLTHTRCELTVMNLEQIKNSDAQDLPAHIQTMEATVTDYSINHYRHLTGESIDLSVSSINGKAVHNLATLNCSMGLSGLYRDMALQNILYSIGAHIQILR